MTRGHTTERARERPRPTGSATTAVVADAERVLRRNGLALLIEGYSAERDVFGRAAPFLLLVLLTQLAGAANLSWNAAANTLAVLGGLLLVGTVYALLNRVRGRAWNTLPQSVDTPELAFFVLAPALLPLVFGGQLMAAVVTAAANTALLALVWFTVRYGFVSTLWWGTARVVDELAASLGRLVRLLPLLLVFSLVLFFNAEIWQVFDAVPPTGTLVLGVVFAALIALALGLHLPEEVAAVLRQAVDRVPEAADLPPLTRAQRANVSAMVLTSQLLQVLVVSIGVGVFFVVVGTVTVTADVQEAWGVVGGQVLWTAELDGTALVVNQTSLRVAVAIATFTGLYFAISMLTDAVYRAAFMSAIEDQLTTVTRTRVAYLRALGTVEVPAG